MKMGLHRTLGTPVDQDHKPSEMVGTGATALDRLSREDDMVSPGHGSARWRGSTS